MFILDIVKKNGQHNTEVFSGQLSTDCLVKFSYEGDANIDAFLKALKNVLLYTKEGEVKNVFSYFYRERNKIIYDTWYLEVPEDTVIIQELTNKELNVWSFSSTVMTGYWQGGMEQESASDYLKQNGWKQIDLFPILTGYDTDCATPLEKIFNELDAIFAIAGNKGWFESVSSPGEMLGCHMTLGKDLRNKYFWGSSELKDYLITLGISHPDDMSGYTLKEYWKYANKK